MTTYSIIFSVGLCLGICLLLLGAVLGIRNNRALTHSKKLIEIISSIDSEEIDQGIRYTGWRLREFQTVSYYRKVFMFWRSFNSFYKGKKFFKEIQERFGYGRKGI